MKHTIQIKTEKGTRSTHIIGYVDDREVITISNAINGQWCFTSSSTIPQNIERGSAYVECYQMALNAAVENGAVLEKTP